MKLGKTERKKDMMNAREFYTAITNTAELSDEIRDYAVAQIAKMDASNAKMRAKNIEKRATATPYVEKVVSLLGKEPLTGQQLVEMLAKEYGITEINEKPVTRQKVSTLLRAAVENGAVAKVMVKGEKGKVTAYTLAE